ncbi:MAG: hypothetical protein ABI193_03550 [Minicystis sp.]
MAPDNEPTDEELALVMREALAVAMARRAASDEWMRRKRAEAVREAAERPDPTIKP